MREGWGVALGLFYVLLCLGWIAASTIAEAERNVSELDRIGREYLPVVREVEK